MTICGVRRRLTAVIASLTCVLALPRVARAQAAAPHLVASPGNDADGVYDRFDGDLDLGLGIGAELGSAGHVAPTMRATAHYYSIAGAYVEGRVRAGDASARSLFGLGIDIRPLFVPRWAKGFETGPALFDLTLDSLALSLGAFWTERPLLASQGTRGFEAGLGFGVPLFARAAGLWLETRGVLRYPDASPREEALFLALAWHGFVLTPLAR